jgi:rhamnosyltransferase
MLMKASIIILTKNAGERFVELLKKIQSQTYGGEVEIVVIDSGSVDGTVEIAERYGDVVEKIKPEDFHHSKTRNLGAEKAEGDYLVYITHDALPFDTHWLENLLIPLEDERVAAVYGRQIAYEEANPIEKFFYSYFYPETKAVITSANLTGNLEDFYISHTFLSDVNSALKKRVWEKYKFDENIIMAEDKKWAIDVLNAGYKLLYEPDAAVYHSHNYSLISAFKRRFDDGVAIKQICGSSSSNLANGFKYLSKQMKYLTKNSPLSIPYTILYDISTFAGLSLGKKEHLIPTRIKKRMSKHGAWWDQYKL